MEELCQQGSDLIVCRDCQEAKSASEFGKHSRRPGGISIYCKPCWALRSRKYREANVEKTLERDRAYKRANRDLLIQKRMDHARRNREQTRVTNDNFRARQVGAEGRYSLQEWLDLLDKYNNQCAKCGSTENVSRDHVVPLSKGGKNTIDNIQPLCLGCNKRKYTSVEDYR